jgi:hypothetical protein
MNDQPRVPAGNPRGGQWTKQIQEELSTISEELSKHSGLFTEASLVGSWAAYIGGVPASALRLVK